MLTALVLQLIQCVVELPDELAKDKNNSPVKEDNDSEGASDKKDKNNKNKKRSDVEAIEPSQSDSKSDEKKELNMDKDVLVCTRYENAMGTAYSFLSVFLQKTGNKSEEIDYRPLFENFVQDLLITVNKPEWPSSELLLSLLGKLLVQKFSNTKTDIALRVSSLDCLGIVAAKLRKDAVTSQFKVDTIDQIIQDIKEEENRDAPLLEDGSLPTENGTNAINCKKGKKKVSDNNFILFRILFLSYK